MADFYANSQKLRRPYQEDAFVIPDINSEEEYKLFAIFDGHNGSACSERCASTVKHIFDSLLAEFPEDSIDCILFELFRRLHTLLLDEDPERGTTATIAILTEHTLYVANSGDSLAFIFTQKQGFLELTQKHHPDKVMNPAEHKRVVQAGAQVFNRRVDGVLSVSRALGDVYLQPKVNWRPLIRTIDLQPDEDTFVVMASDGLWDCFTPVDVAMWIYEGDYDAVGLVDAIKNKLVNHRKASDNATVIAINLRENDNSACTFHELMMRDLKLEDKMRKS